MTELTDLSETDASNTTITGANIAEGCNPSEINNAIRNTLGLIRRAFKASIFRLRDTTDQTKLLAFDLSGITTATTRTITVPDGSGTLAYLGNTQTFDGVKTFSAIPVLSGGGIRFPSTQVPSANANTLDDYEEDTFTPTVVGSSTVGSATYSTQEGTYTKVGNLVSFSIFLVYSGHTGTGNLRIAGLPFTANAKLTTCSMYISDIAFTGMAMAFVQPSTSQVYLYQVTGGSGSSPVTVDAAGTIVVSGHYYV